MTKYNGWTNKTTWLVKLWIDNEQSSQDYWLERASNVDGQIYTLESELMDYFQDEMLPKGLENGLYSDLLMSALAEVNWAEIARSLIEDAVEMGV